MSGDRYLISDQNAVYFLTFTVYTHQNPVNAMIVEEAEHYIFSSARDYSGIKGLVDVQLISFR